MYIRGVLDDGEDAASELESLEMSFSVSTSTGESKTLSPKDDKITPSNAHQYIAQAINFRSLFYPMFILVGLWFSTLPHLDSTSLKNQSALFVKAWLASSQFLCSLSSQEQNWKPWCADGQKYQSLCSDQLSLIKVFLPTRRSSIGFGKSWKNSLTASDPFSSASSGEEQDCRELSPTLEVAISLFRFIHLMAIN